jgi:DNA polymerase III sliding clamp (beta) subunit (PCNA family)
MVDAEESQPMPFSNICDEITITNPLEFSKCISFTSPFASEKDFLSSIFLETNGMSTDIIAMDGFSLAFKKYTQKLVSDEMKWLISKDHIQTVINFFSEDGVKAVKVERDTEGKIRITSEIGELVLLKCTHDYRDFKKNIDAVCPIRTDGSLSENAAVVEVDTEELKKALSHVISMYVRNEYPSVDILIEDNLMRVDTEVTARGYDCFRAEIPVEKKRDNDRYRIQTSPVIMLKALNRYKGKVRLIWTKDADPQKNPICLSQTKTEMVLFTPKSTVPKEDREYE